MKTISQCRSTLKRSKPQGPTLQSQSSQVLFDSCASSTYMYHPSLSNPQLHCKSTAHPHSTTCSRWYCLLMHSLHRCACLLTCLLPPSDLHGHACHDHDTFRSSRHHGHKLRSFHLNTSSRLHGRHHQIVASSSSYDGDDPCRYNCRYCLSSYSTTGLPRSSSTRLNCRHVPCHV